MSLASNAIRGCIIAGPGCKLVVGDLANIEGRMAAWLAGENWKLDAFRAFDSGIGADLYKVAYGRAFNVSAMFDEKTPAGYLQRQIGKVMELMLQYQGGVGAFLTGAATYGIDLEKMMRAAWPTLPPDILKQSQDFYDWTVEQLRTTFGLSREVFVCCDALKRLWRRAHPNIVAIWEELENACIYAIENPGRQITVRGRHIRRDGTWLRIQLPSGRYLCYPEPIVTYDKEGRNPKISYAGNNQYTRKWCRLGTYGGKLFENVTQAAARDVLAYSMPSVEEAGYPIVLSVHDELVTEPPDTNDYILAELCRLMAAGQPWLESLPLAASGFETQRYAKH